jgi:hypothetical protein
VVQTSMAALHVGRARLSSTDASFADQVEGKSVYLDGTGMNGMFGFGGRRVFRGGFRVSVAGSVGGAEGLSLKHAPLQRYDVARHRIWVAGIDVQGGWQFRLGSLWPYLDLQVGARSLSTDMSIRESDGTVISTRSEQAAVWVAALRPGIEIPVGRCTYLDLAVFGSPVGAVRYGASLGVVWEPAGGCRAENDPAFVAARDAASCKGGGARACVDAGDGLERKGEWERALGMYERGCRLWLAEACMRAGRVASTNRDATSERRARRSFAMACEVGEIEGCWRVVQSALQGAPPDHAAARRALERACQASDAPACSQQAELVCQGLGGRRDAAYGLKLHKYACQRGVAESCEKAAAMCERGEGGPRDPACVKWARGFFSYSPARGMTGR